MGYDLVPWISNNGKFIGSVPFIHTNPGDDFPGSQMVLDRQANGLADAGTGGFIDMDKYKRAIGALSQRYGFDVQQPVKERLQARPIAYSSILNIHRLLRGDRHRIMYLL